MTFKSKNPNEMLIIVSNTMYSVPLFFVFKCWTRRHFLFSSQKYSFEGEKKSSKQKLKHALTGEIRRKQNERIFGRMKVYAGHETWAWLFKTNDVVS